MQVGHGEIDGFLDSGINQFRDKHQRNSQQQKKDIGPRQPEKQSGNQYGKGRKKMEFHIRLRRQGVLDALVGMAHAF
ncbi:hypothetical protein D3C72_2541270 [compost metagenome]